MPSWLTLDRVSWPLTLLLAALGLWLLYCGLWSDRARGKPRCFKCGYDLTGAPSLSCPECGWTAKHDKHLYKTRRHWRLVSFAIVLLCLAGTARYATLVHNRRLYRHEPWADAIVPTTYWIVVMPWLDDSTMLSAGNRFYTYGLSPSKALPLFEGQEFLNPIQRWLLGRSCVSILRNLASSDSKVRFAIELVAQVRYKPALVDVTDQLQRDMIRGDPEIGACLEQFGSDAGPAVARIVGFVRSPPDEYFLADATRALGRIGDPVVPWMLSALENPRVFGDGNRASEDADQEVRVLALWTIAERYENIYRFRTKRSEIPRPSFDLDLLLHAREKILRFTQDNDPSVRDGANDAVESIDSLLKLMGEKVPE